jgi:hypothetical protein
MSYVLFLIWCKKGKQAAIDPLEISQHQMLLHQGKTEREKVTSCRLSSVQQREEELLTPIMAILGFWWYWQQQ